MVCVDDAGVGALGADVSGMEVGVGGASVPKAKARFSSLLLFSSDIFSF